MSTADGRDFLRIEPALREIARAPDSKLRAIAERHRLDHGDLALWLATHNRGNRLLSVATIEGVKASLGLTSSSRVTAAPPVQNGLPANKSPKPACFAGGPNGDLAVWLADNKAAVQTAVTSYQVLVTPPPLATAWLALNQGNRKPSRAKVQRFAALIEEGKWLLNGETVKFASSGRLIDGQSRLQAIIEAKRPALLEIRGNLPDAAQQTMDCGESRRGTHTLEMMGEQNALILSPALRLVFKWETGQMGSGGSGYGRLSVLENQAIKPMLDRHGGLRQSVAWAQQMGERLRKLLPLSEAAFFHYVFGCANKVKRDSFFAGLVSRNGVSQPVALLANRIAEAKDGRLGAGVRIRLFVKAWNGHHSGRNLPALVLTPREGVAPIAGAQGGIRHE